MKHKKITYIFAAAVLMSAFGATKAEQLPKNHFKVVGMWSNLAQYQRYEQPFWSKEITEKSGGAITADIKAMNELGLKGPEIGRLLRSGVLDFGTSMLGYMASDDSRNEAVDLAGLSPDIGIARKVTDAYRPALEKLYKDKYNVKLLAVWPHSAQVLFCKSSITGLDDLKGKKIRTSNRSLAEFVDAVGGTGVTLAFSEVVQALQTGVVDCAVTGTLSGYSAKWYEVADYLYTLPVGWSQSMHGVNYNVWNKLDAKTRELMETEIKDLEERIWKSAAHETTDGIACNTGSGPCNYGPAATMALVKVTDADKAQLHKILQDVVVKKWSQRCGPACSNEFNNTIGKVISLKAM